MLGNAFHRPIVLIADDEPSVAEFIGTILKGQGVRVHIVYSAIDALRASKVVPFDAAILDWAMPGLTGAETAAALRRHAPEIRIIAMDTEIRPVQRAVAAGQADAFLPKPFAPDALIAVLNYLLQGSPCAPPCLVA